MQKELSLIGLGKNEASVYEALTQHGPCRAGVLIVKLNIHRNLIYQSLEKLVLKGLATKFISSGVWNFQITDPASLLSSFKQKETILKEIVKQIQTHQHKAFQQIVVYEGIESYRNYWTSSLERIPEGTIDYCVGAPANKIWINMLGKSYSNYLDLRLKKKIKWKTIHFKITESEIKMLQNYPELTEYRLWPRDTECKGNFNIIHDTLILHSITDPPRIIEIRDNSLVTIFQNYFDMMWEKSEPIKLNKA